MRKWLLVGFASLFVTGCANNHIDPVTQLSNVKTIAIVPSIPPEFRIANQGVTVFGNSLDTIDVSKWDLNDLVYEEAIKVLSPRYHVVRATYNDYLYDYDVPASRAINSTMAIEEEVEKKVTKINDADLYLVFSFGERAQPYRDVINIYYAMGISHLNHTFSSEPACLHTYIEVTAIDAKTIKERGRTPLEKKPTADNCGTELEPMVKLTNFEWHDKWQEMSSDQKIMIEDKTKNMIRDSVHYTLLQMFP